MLKFEDEKAYSTFSHFVNCQNLDLNCIEDELPMIVICT